MGQIQTLLGNKTAATDAIEQHLVVAHVLEHLDGHATVERGGRQFEPVRVAGEHAHVGEAALAAALLDETALRRGIRDRGDARVRMAFGHPQRQRTPAAAEFEDVLPVRQLRALTVQREHRLLGFGEGLAPVRIEAARVLQPWPEAALEERRRQLVMLAVGGVGMDRHRAAPQFGDQRGGVARGRGRVACAFVAQALRAHPADAQPQQAIGNPSAFGPAEQSRRGTVAGEFERIGGGVHRSSLGNHGNSIDVLRW